MNLVIIILILTPGVFSLAYLIGRHFRSLRVGDIVTLKTRQGPLMVIEAEVELAGEQGKHFRCRWQTSDGVGENLFSPTSLRRATRKEIKGKNVRGPAATQDWRPTVAIILALISFATTLTYYYYQVFVKDQYGHEKNCRVAIVTPANDTLVVDNGSLARKRLFGFEIEGYVHDLGENKVCIYQKVSGGDEWWRAGDEIDTDDLGMEGIWTISNASCGSITRPHPSCLAKAVVQSTCPPEGSIVQEIGVRLCESPVFEYRTR